MSEVLAPYPHIVPKSIGHPLPAWIMMLTDQCTPLVDFSDPRDPTNYSADCFSKAAFFGSRGGARFIDSARRRVTGGDCLGGHGLATDEGDPTR